MAHFTVCCVTASLRSLQIKDFSVPVRWRGRASHLLHINWTSHLCVWVGGCVGVFVHVRAFYSINDYVLLARPLLISSEWSVPTVKFKTGGCVIYNEVKSFKNMKISFLILFLFHNLISCCSKHLTHNCISILAY